MTKSKLGFHLDLMAHNGQLEKMVAARPRVVKVISAMGILQELYKELGDATAFVARDWKTDDDFTRFGGPSDPKGAAKRWFDAFLPAIKQAPFAYWEAFNEMSNWSVMRQFGEFEAERQRIMHDAGYRCTIGNFSAGSPGDLTLYKEFYPALEAANRYQNLLGLHEYGGLYMWMWYGPNQTDAIRAGQMQPFPGYGEGWLFGRYRKVWAQHLLPNGWTRVRIVLNELGLDRVGTPDVDYLTGGNFVASWKQAMPWWAKLDQRPDGPQYYADQLRWVDRQMGTDHYMLGCTIFTWGTYSKVWGDFDIEGEVADKLCDYIASTRYDADEYVVTDPRGVYMRLYSSKESYPMAVLPYNEIVYVSSITSDPSDSNQLWMRTTTQNGQMNGWVKQQHLQRAG